MAFVQICVAFVFFSVSALGVDAPVCELSYELAFLESLAAPRAIPETSEAQRAQMARISRLFSVSVLQPLGSGAFGDVYLVYDPGVHKYYAVKVARGFETDRVEKEDRIGRKLRAKYLEEHPEIIDPRLTALMGETRLKEGAFLPFLQSEIRKREGEDFLFMEANGTRLSDELSQLGSSKKNLQKSLHVAGQLIDAVNLAERNEVLLQDVKPQNVLIDADGQVHLIDFGLAVDFSHPEDRFQGPSGTLGYMSKDQGKRIKRLGNDVGGLQQTLRNLLLGKAASQISGAGVRVRQESGWSEPFADYAASPHSLDPNVPETLSTVLWLPWRNVREFKVAWNMALKLQQDPAAFYEWMKPKLESCVNEDPQETFQLLGSSRELIRARKNKQLTLSAEAEVKLKAAKKEYERGYDKAFAPLMDPLPLLTGP